MDYSIEQQQTRDLPSSFSPNMGFHNNQVAGLWFRTNLLTCFLKEGFKAPLQFHIMIFIRNLCEGVGHSAPRDLKTSFVCPFPGNKVTMCCRIPNSISWEANSRLKPIVGWKTCTKDVVGLFPMMNNAIGYPSNIYRSVRPSEGFTLHSTGA